MGSSGSILVVLRPKSFVHNSKVFLQSSEQDSNSSRVWWRLSSSGS